MQVQNIKLALLDFNIIAYFNVIPIEESLTLGIRRIDTTGSKTKEG